MKRVLIILSIIFVGTWVMFRCYLWAGRPAFGTAGALSGGGVETQIESVDSDYGPIILARNFLLDPATKDRNWNWGIWAVYETMYRLSAMLMVMWVICCVLLLTYALPRRRKKEAEQGGPGYPPQGVGSPDP